MKTSKKLTTLFSLAFVLCNTNLSFAQSVPQKGVVEHFTNSWCSVCAGSNPALYTTLRNNPNLLHISYFPSSPYSGCQINRYNTAGNDARTRFYSVYGSTPKVVLQGGLVIQGNSFSSSAVFNSIQGQTTALDIRLTTTQIRTDSIKIRATLIKVGSLNQTTALVYGLITTDTLQYNAQNGERTHYNVFRSAFTGNNGVTVTLPTQVGDSLVLNYAIPYPSNWGRVSASLIVQETTTSPNIIQASRSRVRPEAPTGIIKRNNLAPKLLQFSSSNNTLTAKELNQTTAFRIFDSNGKIVLTGELNNTNSINLSALKSGVYTVFAPAINEQLKVVVGR